MKIEEAIVYVLAKRNGGLKTDQIEEAINRERLARLFLFLAHFRLSPSLSGHILENWIFSLGH